MKNQVTYSHHLRGGGFLLKTVKIIVAAEYAAPSLIVYIGITDFSII
jgi:hypothetical protein